MLPDRKFDLDKHILRAFLQLDVVCSEPVILAWRPDPAHLKRAERLPVFVSVTRFGPLKNQYINMLCCCMQL